MLITSDVTAIASILTGRSGSVIAYPTETFYGLGSLISDQDAVERIIEIKGRDALKGMIALVADIHMAHSLAEIGDRQNALLQQFWPGPLSVLLKARAGIIPTLAPSGKIALRVSPNPMALSLIGRTGPVTSTSANLTGMPPARSPEEIAGQHLPIDGILDGGQTPGGRPSTLADLTVWPPVCLREGILPFAEVMKAL